MSARRLLLPALGFTAIAGLAVSLAADITHPDDVSFINADGGGSNITHAAGKIRLASITTRTGAGTESWDWLRSHTHSFDNNAFALEIEKADAGGAFNSLDACLPAGVVTGEQLEVNGRVYRAGPHTAVADNGNQFAPVIGGGAITLDLAAGPLHLEEVRFLTSGSHGDPGAAAYTVTFTYPSGSATIDVPIGHDSDPNRGDDNENTAGPDEPVYFIHGTTLQEPAPRTCGQGKVDEVRVLNPFPGEPTTVEITWPHEDDTWLSGPLALSLAVDEQTYDELFDWRGSFLSSGSSLNAGNNAQWGEVYWNQQLNDGLLRVSTTCGPTNFSFPAPNDFEGPFSATGTDGSGWFGDDPCVGQYGRYLIEFVQPFDGQSPVLDGITMVYDLDADHDGFGADGLYSDGADCDDDNPLVHPETIWFRDGDGDGYGDPTAPTTQTCEPGAGWVLDNTDCDDTSPTVNPGAPDICGNGIDDNCDGLGNHANPGPGGYLDDDADGLDWATENALGTDDCNADTDGDGVDDFTEVGSDPLNPLDTDGDGVIDALDTDDDGDGIPTAEEVYGSVTHPMDQDSDGDGVPDFRDDDDDGDGVPTYWELVFSADPLNVDSDNDGIPDGREWLNWLHDDPSVNCNHPNGYDFCEDLSPSSYPTDPQPSTLPPTGTSFANPWDRDGDGIINALDHDDDGDGIPTLLEGTGDDECYPPLRDGIPNYLDWDSNGDGIPDAVQGFQDMTGTGIPNFLDCAASCPATQLPPEVWYLDSDGDGWGDESKAWAIECDAPAGYGPPGDCDDEDPAVFPGAVEVCNGIDDNCNGLIDDEDPALDLDTATAWYRDADGDGLGDSDHSVRACDPPNGFVENAEDCDDSDDQIGSCADLVPPSDFDPPSSGKADKSPPEGPARYGLGCQHGGGGAPLALCLLSLLVVLARQRRQPPRTAHPPEAREFWR